MGRKGGEWGGDGKVGMGERERNRGRKGMGEKGEEKNGKSLQICIPAFTVRSAYKQFTLHCHPSRANKVSSNSSYCTLITSEGEHEPVKVSYRFRTHLCLSY